MTRTIALVSALLIAAILAWWEARPPGALGPDAPAQVFSAGRALADIHQIARAPHPVGSARNATVRDYVRLRMTELGLAPRIQRGTGMHTDTSTPEPYVLGATVENLVGVLPGRDQDAPALLLMAHYDSVPASPGAADDAAGVASILEVVRALKLIGTPARDVIVLFTDGEEAGLLGAHAFFETDPLAAHAGFVINLEARGGGGRTHLFQTGPDNGAVVDLVARTAVGPRANSLTGYIYKRMPNDTDFTVSTGHGLRGLNFAFIGRQFDYHSPSSTPANLDPAALQDIGQQALAGAAATAFSAALPQAAPDLVYAQTPGSLTMAYRPVLGWAILGASGLLILIGWWRANRRGGLSGLDLLQGLGASAYLLTAGAAALRLARRATGAEFGYLEQRVLLAQATRFEIALTLVGLGVALFVTSAMAKGRMRRTAGLMALGAGVVCSAFGGYDPVGLGLGVAGGLLGVIVFGRAASLGGAWTGALLSALALGVVAQAYAPTTAFILAWPLLVASLASAISGAGMVRGRIVIALLIVMAGVAAGWVGGFGHDLYQALDLPEALILAFWLVALLIWPFAQPRLAGGGRITALAVLLAGFLGILLVHFQPPWSPRHPRVAWVNYFMDLDAGRAWRVAPTADLPAWSRAVLEADDGRIAKHDFAFPWSRPVHAAPAKIVSAPGAALTLTHQTDGDLALMVSPPAGARTLQLDLRSDTPLTGVAVNGVRAATPAKAGEWLHVRWEASPEGTRVVFRPSGRGKLEVRYAATSEAWPRDARPLPPRPADAMAFDQSDALITAGSRRFSW